VRFGLVVGAFWFSSRCVLV